MGSKKLNDAEGNQYGIHAYCDANGCFTGLAIWKESSVLNRFFFSRSDDDNGFQVQINDEGGIEKIYFMPNVHADDILMAARAFCSGAAKIDGYQVCDLFMRADKSTKIREIKKIERGIEMVFDGFMDISLPEETGFTCYDMENGIITIEDSEEDEEENIINIMEEKIVSFACDNGAVSVAFHQGNGRCCFDIDCFRRYIKYSRIYRDE